MLQIKLWSLEKNDSSQYVPKEVEHISNLETEDLLENLIVQNPDLLIPNLKLVGRQTPTAHGSLDLIGVDENGYLIVFELKRGTLSRDAIAQVVDYTSYLGSLGRETLFKHISERSGHKGIGKIEDFESWYQENISDNFEALDNQPKMVLVGLGADDTTRRMVTYLSQSGVDISLITFYGFEKNENIIFAKQIEVEPSTDKEKSRKYIYNKEANLKNLSELADKIKTGDFLEKFSKLITDEIQPIYKYPLKTGYSFSLSDKTDEGRPTSKVYFNLLLDERKLKTVILYIQKIAQDVSKELFQRFLEKYSANLKRDKYGSYIAYLKEDENWNVFAQDFKEFLKSVEQGWLNRD